VNSNASKVSVTSMVPAAKPHARNRNAGITMLAVCELVSVSPKCNDHSGLGSNLLRAMQIKGDILMTNDSDTSDSDIDKWDARFLDLAIYVADWSKDPSTKVGAVLVRPDHEAHRRGRMIQSLAALRVPSRRFGFRFHVAKRPLRPSAATPEKSCQMKSAACPRCPRNFSQIARSLK